MKEKYKQKIDAYNTLRYKGGISPATSKEATMAPGDVAFSKKVYTHYPYLGRKKYKYLILAIITTKGQWRGMSEVAYLMKRSFDKRIPTLNSNHEYYIEEIKLFQKIASVSLKTKLKDL